MLCSLFIENMMSFVEGFKADEGSNVEPESYSACVDNANSWAMYKLPNASLCKYRP